LKEKNKKKTKLKNKKFNFERATFAWNDKLSFFDTAPILLGLTCYRCFSCTTTATTTASKKIIKKLCAFFRFGLILCRTGVPMLPNTRTPTQVSLFKFHSIISDATIAKTQRIASYF
jgi:hypothetical protein